jgi:hypothetical protein
MSMLSSSLVPRDDTHQQATPPSRGNNKKIIKLKSGFYCKLGKTQNCSKPLEDDRLIGIHFTRLEIVKGLD